MTYNIHSGQGHLDSTAAAIRDLSPDVVGLQEVDVHWAERSNFEDQASELGELLGMQVRFARIYQLAALRAGEPPREFGVALLSKLPIRAWRNRVVTRLSTQVTDPLPAPAPGLLEATLDVQGVAVRVFVTHLDYRGDPTVRSIQVSEILEYVGESSGPAILLGDLNATPDAPELQPLFSQFRDAWPSADSPGATYPADAPAKRIDYILVSPQFRLLSVSVGAALASDHRPVIADFLLTR